MFDTVVLQQVFATIGSSLALSSSGASPLSVPSPTVTLQPMFATLQCNSFGLLCLIRWFASKCSQLSDLLYPLPAPSPTVILPQVFATSGSCVLHLPSQCNSFSPLSSPQILSHVSRSESRSTEK